jgi:hypothetical protein
MKPLEPTDTVASIATARLAEAEEARIARIRGSKTNMEYLRNAGVIITCDDAMDNYYHDVYIAGRAMGAGITIAEAEAAFEQERAEENVRSALKWDVSMNETMAENVARRNALMATAVGTKENGRPCVHRTTKSERGWINKEGWYCMTARDDAGNWPFKCCRCGAEVTLIALTEPTEQAKLAAAILAK